MRYRIDGAQIDTGEDVSVLVDATSEADASRQAEALQIAVSSITPKPPPSPLLELQDDLPKYPTWASVVQALTWLAVLVLAGLTTLSLMADVSRANGAPQQAAAGAIHAAFMVCTYVGARAVEKLVGELAR